MSSSSQIKVLIDSKELKVYRITDGKDGIKTKEEIFTAKLERENLPEVLAELKEKHTVDHIGLLFADNLVLTGVARDENGSANDRESVGKLAKAALSIDLEKTVWDYTKVDNLYQIVCLPGDYTDYIAPAFTQSGIKVESIDPVSVSLAKLTANQSEPKLVVYDEVERLVMVSWQGLVFEPTLFIPVELSNKAKKIRQNFNKHFNREVKQAVVSAGFADPYLADMMALSLDAQVIRLDPLTGVEDIAPVEPSVKEIQEEAVKPEPVVAIKPIVNIDSERPEDFKEVWEDKPLVKEKVIADEVQLAGEEEKDPLKNTATVQPDIKLADTDWIKPKRNLTWLWIVVPLIITFVAVGYLLLGGKNKEKVELLNPLIESSLENSQEIASASGQVAKTALKIQVLNGSGKAGEAAKVKGLLETAGFTVETIGNATTSSAVKTEIKSKIALTETIKKTFEDTLGKQYGLSFIVGDTGDHDAIVTVGKSK